MNTGVTLTAKCGHSQAPPLQGGERVTLSLIVFDLDTIKQEVSQLLSRGIINRNQPLYVLCEYLPAREWMGIENELERCGYLLRDRIIDLIGAEKWDSD